MTGRMDSFAKRTTSSSETKRKELKMGNGKNVTTTFKAKGKGPNLKGKSGLREEEYRKKRPPGEVRRAKEGWC